MLLVPLDTVYCVCVSLNAEISLHSCGKQTDNESYKNLLSPISVHCHQWVQNCCVATFWERADHSVNRMFSW